MLKILPYKIGSKSAKVLARTLRCKRIIPDGGYAPRNPRTVVVNWGNSDPHFQHARMLNKPSAVGVAANKLHTLITLHRAGIAVPDYTTDRNVAEEWMEEGYRVVVRHKLQAHSGQGIQIVRPEEVLPNAPLYTKYTRKDNEYRVHVFGDRVIDWSEKCQRLGQPPTNTLIRNHANGWVFCRDGRNLPESGKDLCVKAVQSLGLDFGAVDLIMREGKAWILEINTAPGLEGRTIEAYAQALRAYMGGSHGYY